MRSRASTCDADPTLSLSNNPISSDHGPEIDGDNDNFIFDTDF